MPECPHILVPRLRMTWSTYSDEQWLLWYDYIMLKRMDLRTAWV